MAFFKMTGQTLRNLFTNPATYMYPFKTRAPFKNTRGKLNIELDKCIYCNMCARRCPTDAITVDRDKKSWQVDHLKCIYCGNCVDVCPKKCLFLANKYADSLLRADKAKSIDFQQGAATPPPAPAAEVKTSNEA
jgi:ech hydrogenase subunit F